MSFISTSKPPMSIVQLLFLSSLQSPCSRMLGRNSSPASDSAKVLPTGHAKLGKTGRTRSFLFRCQALTWNTPASLSLTSDFLSPIFKKIGPYLPVRSVSSEVFEETSQVPVGAPGVRMLIVLGPSPMEYFLQAASFGSSSLKGDSLLQLPWHYFSLPLVLLIFFSASQHPHQPFTLNSLC